MDIEGEEIPELYDRIKELEQKLLQEGQALHEKNMRVLELEQQLEDETALRKRIEEKLEAWRDKALGKE